MTAIPSKLARLSYSDYAALEAVNFSSLKEFAKSAAHYKAALEEGTPDTSFRMLGRAKHCLTLEPQNFNASFAVWANGDRRAKGYKDFEATHAPKDVLTLAERDECLALANCVRRHPRVAEYLKEGTPELVVRWDVDGIQCKGRLDFLSESVPAILDLKFTRDASPEGFPREVLRYCSHVQAAWYVDAVKAAIGEELPYILVAAEHPEVPPTLFRVPTDILDLGRASYRRWLKALAKCRETDSYPGYAESEVNLQLPVWAFQNGDQP